MDIPSKRDMMPKSLGTECRREGKAGGVGQASKSCTFWQAFTLVGEAVEVGLLGGREPHDPVPSLLEGPGGGTLPARASCSLLEMRSRMSWQALTLVGKAVAVGLLGGREPLDTAPPLLEDPGGRTLPARASCFLLEMESLLHFDLELWSVAASRSTYRAFGAFKVHLMTFALLALAALVCFSFKLVGRHRCGTFLGSVVLNFLSNLFVGPNIGVNTRYSGKYFDGGCPSTTPKRGS